jgi:hypothetical protein
MATRMQQRRGTAAQWISSNDGDGPTLNAGEIGFETDTNKFKIGDGVSAWVDLEYFADVPTLGGSIDDYVPLTQKGAANGVAELDADGKLKSAQIPNIDEITQDILDTALVAGTGLDKTYNDTAGTYTMDIDSTVVTKDGTQTLTNKTLTSPAINTPTGITKSDVGLGNVDNTSDTNKPVSTATQTALDLKANLDSPTFTGTVTLPTGTVTAGMILDGTIVNADINASAAIAQSKIADLTTDLSSKLALAGGNMTGAIAMGTNKITGLGTPTDSADAATKAYVDAVTEGLHIHPSVVAATTANVDLANALENGDTLDGVTLATGNRVLVKNQTTQSENGIYVVAASGAPTRATDFDAPAEIDGGDFVFVTGGTANDNTGWVQTNTVGTVGTDAIVFTQFSGAGTYTAGNGLTLAGSVFSIDTTITQARVADVSDTEIGYLNGVTSGIQTQLDAKLASATASTTYETISNVALKAPLASPTFTGTVTIPNGAALGTPTSLTLTNATGLPVATGISGLGSNVATFLATPSSANFASMISDEIGTGNVLLSDMATSAQSASYTLVLADKAKVVEMSVGSANNLTVPLNASVAFPVGTQIHIVQTGSGQTTVVATGGVTINTATTLKLRAQWSAATLIKRAENTWVLVGDLATS